MPYQTNAWMLAWLKSARWAAEQLKPKGYDIELKVLDAGGDPQNQMQQLNQLTLEGVNYIIVMPLSETALNSAIDNAIDAGIPVITTSTSSTTNPRPADLSFDNVQYSKDIVTYIAKRTGGKGKAINIHGIAGTEAERTMQQGYDDGLAKYPDIKVAADVYGEWNQSTTQQRVSAILPTLGNVDLIFSKGVAAYGAAEAFVTAGRQVPLQVYGLDWGRSQDANGAQQAVWVCVESHEYRSRRRQHCDQRCGR